MDNSERHVQDIREGLLTGNRVALGKALTLVESSLPSDQQIAQQLLEQALSHTGKSIRIGITGVPGVGKSTFIEAFGLHAIGLGHKVAVLTVDPSSQQSKGSILGDKTRMPLLSTNINAFIRPTASGSALGGVASRTREAILVCEAAGYDVIIVETVGVGQSEIAISSMVDFFVLLMLAGAGDELQGIKKGIMEMADAILITKADGDNKHAALKAKSEYQHALHLLSGVRKNDWIPKVAVCSAKENNGIVEAWDLVMSFKQQATDNDFFYRNRNEQQLSWMHDRLNDLFKTIMFQSPKIIEKKKQLEAQVLNKQITAVNASDQLLKEILFELKKGN